MAYTGQKSSSGMNSARSDRPTRRWLVGLLVFAALMPGVLHAQDGSTPEVSGVSKNAAFAGAVIQRLRIEITDFPWCTAEIESLARELIRLHEAEAFSPERLQQSVAELELSGRFEEILPDITAAEGGVMVTLRLKPVWVIRDIRVAGNYPLFESDILKAMSVYPGDGLFPATPAAQEALIADLYRREGYLSPAVTVTSVKDARQGTAILDVRIQPGIYYVLDPLTITGNTAMTEAEIKSRMRIWRSSFFFTSAGRFRETDLAQDIKDLTSQYRKRHYPECAITSSVQKDARQAKAAVALTIAEGPRYEVRFTGNRRFWSYTLKKDLVLFTEGNRRDRGVRKSIENIRQRYRMDGYLSTQVVVLEEKIALQDRATRRLEFSIDEGPQTQVGSVQFVGNTGFDAATLRKAMQSGQGGLLRKRFFIPDLLDDDLGRIQALYVKAGYNELRIEHALAWNSARTVVDITVQISEGIRTTVAGVKITGLARVGADDARQVLQLKTGEPFRKGLLVADRAALSEYISEQGHPYVQVKGDVMYTPDPSQAQVLYQVEEGPAVSMGTVYFRGNFKTRPRALNRELGIKPGQPFSLKTMLQGQKNIRDMGIFDTVQFKTIGLKEKADRITLLVDMEEIAPYYIQAGAGYTSDRGLYGNTRIGDRNLFGLNNDAWLGGEISQIGYHSELSLTQRRIFETPIASTLAVSYDQKEEFNKDFGTKVWASSVSFRRELKPQHLDVSLGFRYERRDEYPRGSSPEAIDTYDPRSILVTTPAVAFDTRDNFVRPTKGVMTSLSVDISKGLQNSIDNFLKYYLDLHLYWRPAPRITLAWLGRGGYIETFGNGSTLPDDQLLYLGGTFSVRGFEENMLRYDASGNAVGGRMSIVGSMEARFELQRNWELTLFSDTGAVRRAFIDAGSDQFRSSVGLGLRYITPIGPMGLLYGHKLNRKDGESAGRVHFSIMYTF